MEISLLSVVGRLVPSLGLILGGLLLVRWWLQKGRGGGLAAPLRVTSRTAVTRSASVAVVEGDGRRFLVGVTDQAVNLLAELDRPTVVAPDGDFDDLDLDLDLAQGPDRGHALDLVDVAGTTADDLRHLEPHGQGAPQDAAQRLPSGVTDLRARLAARVTPDDVVRPDDASSNHPRTGLVDRLQRATTRTRPGTTWRRVDDVEGS